MYPVKRNFLVGFVATLLLFQAVNARAAEVDNLYSAKIEPGTPVERQVEAALAQVLVKVSGDRHIMQRPSVQTLLDNASLLQQAQADEGRIGFDPVGLKNLMASLELPVLSDDRPQLLVWLVRAEGGQAELAEPGGAIFRQLFDALRQRGVPLQQPLMDLTDQLALSPQDLVNGAQGPIQEASARYQGDAVLVGVQTGDELSWTLWWDGRSIAQRSAADPLSLRQFADLTADRVLGIDVSGGAGEESPALTLEPVGSYQPEGVEIEIEGIASPAAYLDVTGWLRQQSAVKSVFTAGQSGQTLKLIIQIDGGAQSLDGILVENPRLMPSGERRYRWADL
ncbi:DUF2066 domain-containing protein [Marinobacterium lacunae]|nr:DUF2066 domain-containing protein [Marinobacterium lacunae]